MVSSIKECLTKFIIILIGVKLISGISGKYAIISYTYGNKSLITFSLNMDLEELLPEGPLVSVGPEVPPVLFFLGGLAPYIYPLYH